jgi:hypothetical protein
MYFSHENEYVGGGIFIVNSGGSLAGHIHKKVNYYDFKTGIIFMPYRESLSPKEEFPINIKSGTEFSPFVEIKYKSFSLLLSKYSTDTIFSSSKQIGIDKKGIPILEVATLSAKSDYIVYMIGYTHKF